MAIVTSAAARAASTGRVNAFVIVRRNFLVYRQAG